MKKEDEDMSASAASDDVVFEDEAEENNPQAVIKKLREQLKACQQEKQDYLEGWQRAKADFINARKDEERERGELRTYAKATLLHELFPIVDNFERAMADKEVWEGVPTNWRVGVEYLYTQLAKVLTDHGVEALGRVGEKFDPSIHQSAEAIPTDDHAKDDTLASIYEKGYRYHGRLLRPARVRIWHYTTETIT